MRNDLRRILAALGWLLLMQALWGAALAAALLSLDKEWLADTFLDPAYRQNQRLVIEYTNDVLTAILWAAGAIFLIGLTASLFWILIAGTRPIYGPGQAARLRGVWIALLIFGAAGAAGIAYYLINDLRLVPFEGTVDLAVAGTLIFLCSYYLVGTFWPTPPKLRPAVPLARHLTTGGGATR